MDLLMDQLTTSPIQMGWEFSIKLYQSGQFGFIDDPDRQFSNSLVCTRTRTQSDGPAPLLTLPTALYSSMVQDQKSLALCWRSFLEWGNENVPGISHIMPANNASLDGCNYVTLWLPKWSDWNLGGCIDTNFRDKRIVIWCTIISHTIHPGIIDHQYIFPMYDFSHWTASRPPRR